MFNLIIFENFKKELTFWYYFYMICYYLSGLSLIARVCFAVGFCANKLNDKIIVVFYISIIVDYILIYSNCSTNLFYYTEILCEYEKLIFHDDENTKEQYNILYNRLWMSVNIKA